MGKSSQLKNRGKFMYKLAGQIVISLVVSVIAELVLDHFFRKPKAQLKLPYINN